MSKRKELKEALGNALFATLSTTNLDKTPGELGALKAICKEVAGNAVNLSEYQAPAAIELYKSRINAAHFSTADLAKITKTIRDFFPGEQHKELRELIDLPLMPKLARKFRRDRRKELAKIKERKIEDPEFTKVKDIFRDRMVVRQHDFNAVGAKSTGVSAGYIAQEKDTGNTFILKHFYKNHEDCLKIQNPKKQLQAIDDRRDGVQELVGSTIYKFLLYDRTPDEALVEPQRSQPNSLFIRSKFFDNVVQFSGGFGGNNKNLRNLEGFEKVIAACHMLGELDYHTGNLMVKDGKTVTKIDHGRSLMAFHQDFGTMANQHLIHSQNLNTDMLLKQVIYHLILRNTVLHSIK